MHISGKFSKNTNIDNEKANIEEKLSSLPKKLSSVTINHIYALHSKYSKEDYFTKKDVEYLTTLKSTRAYELIKLLLNANIIEPVKGHGKGKYRFIQN